MEEPGRLQSMGSLESDMTERLHFHALEKEMATPSSVLPWRIPGMGKQWLTLFFWAPKSLKMVTAAMKLKDAYSLEGKL